MFYQFYYQVKKNKEKITVIKKIKKRMKKIGCQRIYYKNLEF